MKIGSPEISSMEVGERLGYLKKSERQPGRTFTTPLALFGPQPVKQFWLAEPSQVLGHLAQ